MVQSYRDRIQEIFSDVAPEHKFWLVTGGEVNNLSELVSALHEMSDEVFSHHVNPKRNDFAAWVQGAVKDEELARTMKKITTRDSTIKAIRLRIASLKNLQSIHEAIDSVKSEVNLQEKDVTSQQIENDAQAIMAPGLDTINSIKEDIAEPLPDVPDELPENPSELTAKAAPIFAPETAPEAISEAKEAPKPDTPPPVSDELSFGGKVQHSTPKKDTMGDMFKKPGLYIGFFLGLILGVLIGYFL